MSALLIFFITLESFYLFRIPFVFFGLFFIVYLKLRCSSYVEVGAYENFRKLCIGVFFISILITINYIVAILDLGYFNISEHIGNINVYYIHSLVKLFSMLLVVNFVILSCNVNMQETIFRRVLKMHVYFFLIQWFLASYFNLMVDPTNMIGESSSNQALFNLPFTIYNYRVTGFFEEPSTYFAYVFPMALICFSYSRKMDRLLLLTVLSFVLTFSTAAAFVLTIFGILYTFIFYYRSKKIIFLLPIIVIFTACMIYLNYDRFSLDINNSSHSASSMRIDLIRYILNADFFNKILGVGFFDISDSLIKDISTGLFSSINDAGLIFFVLYKFGVFGVLMLIFFGYVIRKDKIICIGYLSILLTKINPLTYSFAMYIYVFYILPRQNRRE